MKEKRKHRQLLKLNKMLIEHFNESELRALCFNLAVDYESLSGSGKDDRSRELVSYMTRRGRILELENAIREARPNILWSGTKRVLQNLPQPDNERFIGRKTELNTIKKLLSPTTRHFVITIDGIGGIGKSALALETARRYWC